MTQNPRLLALQSLNQSGGENQHTPPFANPSDRGLFLELVRGVLRHRLLIDFWIGKVSTLPLTDLSLPVLNSLRLGIYQIFFLQMPPHAAVHETVELIEIGGPKKAKGFVNAALRQFLRIKDEIQTATMKPSLRYSFPEPTIERFRDCLAFDHRPPTDIEPLLASLNATPKICIRVNSSVSTREELKAQFQSTDASSMVVGDTQESPVGLIIEGQSDLRALPGYASGAFIVQSEASQLIAPLLAPFNPGDSILDACAAPGGKTTHLAQLCAANSSIVALCPKGSKSSPRTERIAKKHLLENIARLKAHQVTVVESNAQDYARNNPHIFFDKILVDAPCTGLGTIAKNPERKWNFQPKDSLNMAVEQKSILSALWPLLKPGGVMVYSVCTLSKPEWLAFEGLNFPTPKLHVFWPHVVNSEGLFAAVFKKAPDVGDKSTLQST